MEQSIPKKSVSKFLKRYHSRETIRSYQRVLVAFLDYVFDIEQTHRVDGPGSAPDIEFYDRLALDYLDESRDYAGDLAEYIAARGPAPAPGTIRKDKTVIIGWLGANKIFLHPQETRGIRTGGRARTRDRIPTPDELKQIMEHCDLQMRLYLLMLSSSGMRPGEAIRLQWTDIDEARGRVFIRAEITKTRESRVCFISREAMDLYQQWKVYYPRYLEKIDALTPWADTTSDTRLIFPTTYNSILEKFTRALKKAGLDERDPSTRRTVIHLHGLRKYFRTRLPMGGATVDVTEELMGHEGYLSGSYLRLTEADLEAAYRQTEPALWIYRTKPINEGELKQLESENRELRGELADIQRQIATMNAMQADINANPEALQRLVDARIKELMGKSSGA